MTSQAKLAKGKHIFIYSVEYSNNDTKLYQSAVGMAEGLTNYIRYIDNRDVDINSGIFNNYFRSGRLPIEVGKYIKSVNKERLDERYKEGIAKIIQDKIDSLAQSTELRTEYSDAYLNKQRLKYIKERYMKELNIEPPPPKKRPSRAKRPKITAST